jgi:proteasome accessory factor B
VARQVDSIPPEERLFDIVLALMATNLGLTKADILQTVPGYAARYDAADQRSVETLERQFERDKASLRELGILIETLDDPSQPGNNQLARYRIPRSEYELPEGVTFTAEELAMLGLAATVWRDGSMSADSRRALTKLRGLGVPAAEPVIGFLPLVRTLEPALEPLRTAIADGRIVEFDYLRPTDGVPRRWRLSPLALVHHEGRWLLVGAAEDGFRLNFLIRRIVGEVRVTRETGIPPEPDEESRALAGLQELWAGNVARVEVVPGSDAWVRLHNRTGATVVDSGVLELHWTDFAIFADELVALHPEVRVLGPQRLIDRVIERLRGIGAAHE